jgi:hypothetical protein
MSALLPRRRFLLALAAGALGAPHIALSAEEKAALEIIVDKDDWGSASPAEIRAVALSAAQEIWRFCPGELMRPIRIYHRRDFPLTDFLHDWRGRIRIGLASEDTRWAQMAFQFGHEFCHALAQHSSAAKRSWHPAKHANLWFEESLCEAGSLFVLRKLTVTWQTQPPYPQWRSSANSLADFATERLNRPDNQLPEGQSFPVWFQKNEGLLRQNATLRARNVIVARQLLPLFEAEPPGWDAICYLNLGAHKPDKTFAQYLAEWKAATPAPLQAFVGRITALFRA